MSSKNNSFPDPSPELKKAIQDAIDCMMTLNHDGVASCLLKAARIIKEEDAKVFYPAAAEIKEGDLVSFSEGKAWPAGRVAETPKKDDDHFGWPWAAMLAAFFFSVAYMVTHAQ